MQEIDSKLNWKLLYKFFLKKKRKLWMGFSRKESVSPLVVDINGKFQEGKVKSGEFPGGSWQNQLESMWGSTPKKKEKRISSTRVQGEKPNSKAIFFLTYSTAWGKVIPMKELDNCAVYISLAAPIMYATFHFSDSWISSLI